MAWEDQLERLLLLAIRSILGHYVQEIEETEVGLVVVLTKLPLDALDDAAEFALGCWGGAGAAESELAEHLEGGAELVGIYVSVTILISVLEGLPANILFVFIKKISHFFVNRELDFLFVF